MTFSRKNKELCCLSADNKFEVFSVNVDRPDAILKKLSRSEKKSLKRTYSEANLGEDEVKVDKEKLAERIEQRDYDFAVHFTKEVSTVIDASNKARAFVLMPNKECIFALHNNRCLLYKLGESPKQISTYGELHTHQMAVRGVQVSPNDSSFVTYSFDCVKVWSVDLFRSTQSGELTIECK